MPLAVSDITLGGGCFTYNGRYIGKFKAVVELSPQQTNLVFEEGTVPYTPDGVRHASQVIYGVEKTMCRSNMVPGPGYNGGRKSRSRRNKKTRKGRKSNRKHTKRR
jgi:hypothetical protein